MAQGARPDDYGARANRDLVVTRGDGFRKEKNKKKRGSYRGGDITVSLALTLIYGSELDNINVTTVTVPQLQVRRLTTRCLLSSTQTSKAKLRVHLHDAGGSITSYQLSSRLRFD